MSLPVELNVWEDTLLMLGAIREHGAFTQLENLVSSCVFPYSFFVDI